MEHVFFVRVSKRVLILEAVNYPFFSAVLRPKVFRKDSNKRLEGEKIYMILFDCFSFIFMFSWIYTD